MKRPAPTGGSQPEEQYVPATREKMFLDRPTSHGSWPEGEYDPPVRDRIYGWYKKMKMMPESDAGAAVDEYIDDHREKTMKITESMLRKVIREEISRLNETEDAGVTAAKAFRSKKFKTEAEMQAAKSDLAKTLSGAGVNGEDAIMKSLEGAGYGDAAVSFASELAGMQGKK